MFNIKMILKFLLLFGLIFIADGKDCPEFSKPHLTRCDMYYKCLVLPSGSHVWVPSKCDRGLIYEHSLRLCVLPADDWECTLGEAGHKVKIDDNNNIYGVNNLQYLKDEIEKYRPQYYDSNFNLQPISDNVDDSVHSDNRYGDSDYISLVNNDTYDDNNIEVVDGLDTLNSKSDGNNTSQPVYLTNGSDDDMEFSGDGNGIDESQNKIEDKSNYIAIPIDAEGEPQGSVSTQLQRLTQLIQSLSDSQRNKSQTYELQPNDLNSFLANHNIKTEYHYQPVNYQNKEPIRNDGHIAPEHLSEILNLQQQLQALEAFPSGAPMTSSTTPMTPPLHYSALNDKNFDPTRIQIKGPAPANGVHVTDPGYSSSQIVVNRPEGSVLFSLPSNPPPAPQNTDTRQQQTADHEPYISQDTLKAVLELSKQLISNNNNNNNNNNNYNRNQASNIPEQNFLQPIFRPVYYNIPIHDLPIPIINNYEKETDHKKEFSNSQPQAQQIQQHNDGDRGGDNMQKISTDQVSVSSDGDDKKTGDEHATIIHNHIPITIESPSPSNKQVNRYNQVTKRPFMQPSTTETRYDSFGGKVVTTFSNPHYAPSDYRPYPPFSENRETPPFSYNQQLQIPSAIVSPPFSNYQYNYQSAPSGEYYQQDHNSPLPQSAYGAATGAYNPYAQNYQNLYTQTPHLSDHNVNSYVNLNTPSYPTLRPLSAYSTVDPVPAYQNQINSPAAASSGHNEDVSIAISNNNHRNPYIDQGNPNNKNHLNGQLFEENNNSDDDNDDDDDNDSNNSNSYDTVGISADGGGGGLGTGSSDGDASTFNFDLENEANVIKLLSSLKKKQQQDTAENKQLPEADRRHSFVSSLFAPFVGGHVSDVERDDNFNDNNEDNINDGDSNDHSSDDDPDAEEDEETKAEDRKQIVHYGDTYMTYAAYKKSVAPLLRKGSNKIEMLSCVTGARQPSSTDCSKYFVCNAATGSVLTYVCPSYTAFNKQTRFCDAKTYATCNSVAIKNQITIDGNRKLQAQAEQALQDAKRVRDQAIKAQQLTALINLETQHILNSKSDTYIRRPSSIAQAPVQRVVATGTGVISPAIIQATTTKRPRRKNNKPRRRRIQCSEPTKVADKLSKYNYFTCYKGSDGKLKAMKQTCPGGLEFCGRMRLCTSKDRCGGH